MKPRAKQICEKEQRERERERDTQQVISSKFSGLDSCSYLFWNKVVHVYIHIGLSFMTW